MQHQHVRIERARVFRASVKGLVHLLFSRDAGPGFTEAAGALDVTRGLPAAARRLIAQVLRDGADVLVQLPQRRAWRLDRSDLLAHHAGRLREALDIVRQGLLQLAGQDALHLTRGTIHAPGQHLQVMKAHRVKTPSALAAQGLQRRRRRLAHGAATAFVLEDLGTGAISTRRFKARPFSSALEATGCSGPKAAANTREEGMP